MGTLAFANRVGQRIAAAAFGVATLALGGCGGGGGGVGAPPPGGDIGGVSTYTVGGTVTGLSSNDSVTVLMNGANPLTVSANGVFAFTKTLGAGNAYTVTIQSRTPGRSCSLTRGSGTLASANVNDVEVSCSAANFSVLSDLTDQNNGRYLDSTLLMDGAGNFYGTTNGGGVSDNGTVFKLSRNGDGSGYTRSVLYKFTGAADGSYPNGNLIMDGAGNLYGTTSAEGAGYGTVFKLSPGADGYIQSTLYSFDGGSDGAFPRAGLIMDGAGKLYGTTRNGGLSQKGTVFKLSPAGTGYIKSTLYNFTAGRDGMYPTAPLIMDSAGNLYGTTSQGNDSSNGSVFKLAPSGSNYVLSTLYAFEGGLDGQLPQAALVMDNAGNLYGTTSSGGIANGGTVFKLQPSGTDYTKSTLYTFGGESDGSLPRGALIIDPAGNLYGTTSDGLDTAGAVFRLTPSGSTYFETTLYSFENNERPVAALTMDSAGNLYGTTFSGGASGYGTVFKIGN